MEQTGNRLNYMSSAPAISRPIAISTSTSQGAPSSNYTSQNTKLIVSALKTKIIQAGLHELYAATEVDGAATTGFALATIGQLLIQKRYPGNSIVIFWARHDLLQHETGYIYPPGLIEFGVTPAAMAMVHTHSVQDTLQAGLDAIRRGTLAAVLVEFRGSPRAYDLSASRKLSLAAKSSGVPLFMLRHAAPILPSAAETRWSVRAFRSRALAANAPGRPAFDVTLLRHRGGKDGQQWRVEWNRDSACFEHLGENTVISAKELLPPLSGDLVAFSSRRAAAPANGDGIFRKAG
jgi:protein ImuA